MCDAPAAGAVDVDGGGEHALRLEIHQFRVLTPDAGEEIVDGHPDFHSARPPFGKQEIVRRGLCLRESEEQHRDDRAVHRDSFASVRRCAMKSSTVMPLNS